MFVADQDAGYPRVFIDRVVDRQDVAAGDAEDRSDSLRFEGLDDGAAGRPHRGHETSSSSSSSMRPPSPAKGTTVGLAMIWSMTRWAAPMAPAYRPSSDRSTWHAASDSAITR